MTVLVVSSGRQRLFLITSLLATSLLFSCRSRSSLVNLERPTLHQEIAALAPSESRLVQASLQSTHPLLEISRQESRWAKEATSAVLIGKLNLSTSDETLASGNNLHEEFALGEILKGLGSSQSNTASYFEWQGCLRDPSDSLLEAFEKSQSGRGRGSGSREVDRRAWRDYGEMWVKLLSKLQNPSDTSCLQALQSKPRLSFQFILLPDRDSSLHSELSLPVLRQAILISAEAYGQTALMTAREPLPPGHTVVALRSDVFKTKTHALVAPSRGLFSENESNQAHRAMEGSRERLRRARKNPLIDSLLTTHPGHLADLSTRLALLHHWAERQMASFDTPLERAVSPLERRVAESTLELTQSLIKAFAGRPFSTVFGDRAGFESSASTAPSPREGLCAPSDLELGPDVFLHPRDAKSLSKIEVELLTNRLRACEVSDLLVALSLAEEAIPPQQVLTLALGDVFMSTLALLTNRDFGDVTRSPLPGPLAAIGDAYADEYQQHFQSGQGGPEELLWKRLSMQRSLRNATRQIRARLLDAQSTNPAPVSPSTSLFSPHIYETSRAKPIPSFCPPFSHTFLKQESGMALWSECFRSLRSAYQSDDPDGGSSEWIPLWNELVLAEQALDLRDSQLSENEAILPPDTLTRSAMALKAQLMSSLGPLITRHRKLAPWNDEKLSNEALAALSLNLWRDLDMCANALSQSRDTKSLCADMQSGCFERCARSAHHQLRHEFWPANYLLCLEKPSHQKPTWSCTAEFDSSADDGFLLRDILSRSSMPPKASQASLLGQR